MLWTMESEWMMAQWNMLPEETQMKMKDAKKGDKGMAENEEAMFGYMYGI